MNTVILILWILWFVITFVVAAARWYRSQTRGGVGGFFVTWIAAMIMSVIAGIIMLAVILIFTILFVAFIFLVFVIIIVAFALAMFALSPIILPFIH